MYLDRVKFLREEIPGKEKELKDLRDKLRSEKRARTEEEKTNMDSLVSEIKNMRSELEELEEEVRQAQQRANGNNSDEKRNAAFAAGGNSTTQVMPEVYSTNLGEFKVYNRNNLKEDRSDIGLGAWLRLVATKKPRNDNEERALSISTDSAGGYLAPENLSTQFLYGLTNYSSVIKAGANLVSLDGPGKSWAFTKQTTIPTMTWKPENTILDESDPAFAVSLFMPQKAGFFFKVSNETLSDAINGEEVLREICLKAGAEGIDSAALNGTGSSNQPLGILNFPGINSVDFSSSAPTNYDKIIDARQEIVGSKGNIPSSVIVHPRTVGQFAKLNGSGDGQPLMKPELIKDLQWYESQAISVTENPGTNSLGVVGDFSQLWIGIRQSPMVFIDPFSESKSDSVVFRMTLRMDVLATRAEHFCLLDNIGAS